MYRLNSGPDPAGQADHEDFPGPPPEEEPESRLTRLGRQAAALTRPTAALPRLTRRRQLADAAVALVFALVAIRYSVNAPNAPAGPLDATLLAALAAAPLGLRRRTPLAALWTQLVLSTALLLRHAYADVLFVTCLVTMIALYSAVAYTPYRELALASLPFAGAVLVGLFSQAKLPNFPNGLVGALTLFPVVVAAVGHRVWARRAEESRARLRALELDQIEALRQAVEHERSRIARDLHDVVTHNVSVMVIQAGAGRMVVDKDPALAKEALLAIETGGRAAMTDLRQVMGLLTMDGSGEDSAAQADLTPQPGLDGLEALVGRIRLTGIHIELRTTGERHALPPGVELTAYRVVQEALTNMVKHAVGASAVIHVDYGPRELSVEILNTEGHPGEAATTGSGRGLLGLRERLTLYGGSLSTGLRLTGGYRVKAVIPLNHLESM
jgi:signal transduction histidine kinase